MAYSIDNFMTVFSYFKEINKENIFKVLLDIQSSRWQKYYVNNRYSRKI